METRRKTIVLKKDLDLTSCHGTRYLEWMDAMAIITYYATVKGNTPAEIAKCQSELP
jgi:hypothetical protein